ncbi:MAG TPA: cation:proton antiporter [Polyangia bacterium]|nr:cation:proton antiporter [Polyangia bacterium]
MDLLTLAMALPLHRAPLDLLTELALIMCVAAVTTALFQRLRQPVVLGYLLAGMLVGPHLPVPLFADESTARELSELGVVLIMFSLGLEFSLRKLVRVAPTAGVVAVIECSLMVSLGFLVGRAFGWTRYEALFGGAALAISSTTIIVKAFAEQRVSAARAEIVFGILVVEDLIAILLLAFLTAAASGARLDGPAMLRTVGRLAGFLVVLLAAGMLLVPRLVRAVVRLRRAETTVVAAVGLCFAFALLARKMGYSVALGAFLCGALVAESGAAKLIAHRIEPVRDLFAAVFFVSVGMLIDPRLIWAHGGAVLALTGVVVAGKLVGVTIGAFVAGYGIPTAVQTALSMGQIGEFSFIIAGVGLSLGVTGNFLYPEAVAVSALTTLLTPFLIRAAGRVGTAIDRRLPHTLQTYATLYSAWVQGLRATPEHRTAWSRIRRLVRWLLLDLVLCGAIVIAGSLSARGLARWAVRVAGIAPTVARLALIAATLALLFPFVLGAVRMARALAAALAAEALPPPADARTLDLATAPRRALVVTLQIAILLVAGVPLVAITQPFLPRFEGMAILLLSLGLLAVALWRSATNLEGHVRAGAQVFLEHLAAQSGAEKSGPHPGPGTEARAELPGLGNAQAIRLAPDATAVGKTIRALDLRGLTGATIIAIDRQPADLVYPTAEETLCAGDTLVVTGAAAAVEAARELLGRSDREGA